MSFADVCAGVRMQWSSVARHLFRKSSQLQVSTACTYRMSSGNQAYPHAQLDVLHLLRRPVMGEAVNGSARIDCDLLQSRALAGWRLSPTS